MFAQSRAADELVNDPKAYARLVASNDKDLRLFDRASVLFKTRAVALLRASFPDSWSSDSPAIKEHDSVMGSGSLDGGSISDLKTLLGVGAGLPVPGGSRAGGRYSLEKNTPMKTAIGWPLASEFSAVGGSSPSASPLGTLGSVVKDRSGFGGHSDFCHGVSKRRAPSQPATHHC